jgi:hypothetical protein
MLFGWLAGMCVDAGGSHKHLMCWINIHVVYYFSQPSRWCLPRQSIKNCELMILRGEGQCSSLGSESGSKQGGAHVQRKGGGAGD